MTLCQIILQILKITIKLLTINFDQVRNGICLKFVLSVDKLLLCFGLSEQRVIKHCFWESFQIKAINQLTCGQSGFVNITNQTLS